MRLIKEVNDLNKEIIGESFGYSIYIEQINESNIKVGIVQTAGGLLKKSLQGIGKFAKKHPFITGAMAAYAVNAIRNYKKNKRKTITMYTQDVEEKKLYKDIVDQLMKTGKYRKEKETFVDGGYLFVLKKLG